MISRSVKKYNLRRRASRFVATTMMAKLRITMMLVFILLLVGNTRLGCAQERIKAQRPTETLSQFAERTLREERNKEGGSKEAKRKDIQAQAAQTILDRRAVETRVSPKQATSSRASSRSLRRSSATSPRTMPPNLAARRARLAPDVYLSGEANVTLQGIHNQVIRLGLAANGVTVIEFPAADRFYALHPGNSELVSIDESPTQATDRFFVVRAGTAFTAPPGDNAHAADPATSIIVQMRSGMLVTFLIYPVADMTRMAHRCIVRYSPKAIVEARRAAGLSVNFEAGQPRAMQPALDGLLSSSLQTPNESSTAQLPAQLTAMENALTAVETSSMLTDINNSTVSARQIDGESQSEFVDMTAPPAAAMYLNLAPLPNQPLAAAATAPATHAADPQQLIHESLMGALASPDKFSQWTGAVNGLMVSALSPIQVDTETSLVIVAVRNSSNIKLRIAAGHPQLQVQSLNQSKRPLSLEPLERLHVETTTLDGLVSAGATVYYAIAYRMITLNQHQRLHLSVQHTEVNQNLKAKSED